MTPTESEITTDRDRIEGWAAEHGVVPVREGDRLVFVPEADVATGQERLDWDGFHRQIGEEDRVVMYHGGVEGRDTFEVLDRSEAMSRADVEREEFERRLVEGETVTTEVTETTVVERTIVERAQVESELVDTQMVDQRVLDVELLRRECTSCDLVEDRETDPADRFDADRYLGSHVEGETAMDEGEAATGAEGGLLGGNGEYPYHAELEIEEGWSVTREFIERFTVESRIADTDVSETDTVQTQEIDAEGVQRAILESDLFETDRPADEIMTRHDIQTEFTDGDVIRTHFNRRQVVEDEVVDRKRFRADLADGETLEMEVIETRPIESEFTDDEALIPVEGEAGDAGGMMTGTGSAMGGSDEEIRAAPTEDDEGKPVVDANGERIGMIVEVDEGVAYVDPHPSLTAKIMARLDWSKAGEDDYPLRPEQIARITDDQVELSTSGFEEDEDVGAD